jgi:aminomuconate-semialdehyde/2-hydroxymuconate-6-semialdehyde dehydrogenase
LSHLEPLNARFGCVRERVIQNHVAGQPVAPARGQYLDNVEPATGSVYSRVADSDERDVNAAVAAAEAAFPAWSTTPGEQRSRLLLRLAELIEQNLDALALAESTDSGKPISLARRLEIPRAAANFRFFATGILHQRSDLHDSDGVALNYTLRRPRGVAGLISPWNLPLYLLTWKIAPALAAGNTVVAKPSELTPLTAGMLAELSIEAGLPPGVLNIVHGRGASAGAALVRHPRVTTLSFTGGTRTGAEIAQSAAGQFKKVALELGGKNPNVIFADADFDEALETGVRAAFQNQGQICLCGSRVLVEAGVFDSFVERFVERTRALRQGDPLDDATEQGALVSRAHLEKVGGYVELARAEGGRVLAGGQPPSPPNARCAGGYFFSPTVVTGLGPDCRVNQEEIFGPVVTLLPFRDEAQAVELANATAYGLAATLWTRDLRRAHRVAERIQSGTVWVNCWLLRDLRVPFGGMKQSGLGREGGEEAWRFFTEPKNVCIRL